MTLDLELPKQLEKKLSKELKIKKLTASQYLLKLMKNDLDSTYNLGKGYFYNTYLGKLFNSKEEEIHLTEKEKDILILLIEHNGELVETEKIINKVWKKNNVSIFTFRNMIKKLRDKTYYEIIKSSSNRGYNINIK